MPKKKDYGPPIRRSQRLTTEALEGPIDEATDEASEQAIAPTAEALNQRETLDIPVKVEDDIPVQSTENDFAEEYHSAPETDNNEADDDLPKENLYNFTQTLFTIASGSGN